MLEGQRSGRAWAKWCRRGIVAVVVMVLLVFFGSNLLMGTAWFRGKIEGRMMVRTRLMWTVEELTWSPWGGVRMGNLKAVAAGPEADRIPPIAEIKEVRVRPYWKALLGGKVRVREVSVTEPRGHLPLELLAQLMRSDGRVDPARLGAEEGTGSTGKKPPKKKPPKKKPPQKKPPKKKPPQKKPSEDKPAEQKPVEPEPPEPEVEPAGRLVVNGGEVVLYSLSAPERSLRVSGLRMDVPFSGGEATGFLEAGGVRFAGEEVAGRVKLPVGWKQGVIEWPVGEFEWNGLTVQTAGAVRIRGRLLGTVEVRVVAPRVGPQAVPGWKAAQFATGPLEVRARLTGDVIRPVTWQGNLVASVRGVQVVHSGRGESVVFEQGRLVTDLRGGVLQVVDATLASEQLSMFGNGLVLVDGRAYGVGRVVAAPELAEEITRVANGSMVYAGWVRSWMAPLGTPDRYYRDVYLRGRLPDFEFDLGRDGQWMDAERTWKLLRMFVVREEREEQPEAGGEEGGGS